MAKRPTTTASKPNDIFNRMTQLSLEGSNAARTGGGRGFWPGMKPNAIHGDQAKELLVCQITGFHFDPEGMTYTNDAGEQVSDPTCHFTYLITDERVPEWTGKEVTGNRWWIPLNSGPPANEIIERMRQKDQDRFAGFVEDFLGRPTASWGQDIKELQACFENLEEGAGWFGEISFEWYHSEKEKVKKSKTGEGEQTVLSKNDYCNDYLVRLIQTEDEEGDGAEE